MTIYSFDVLLSQFQRRQWNPTPVLLPGKSYGRRSLVGCSPWGRCGSDTTERLHFNFHFHALEKEMATHSSVLAWRIPGTGDPGGLPSMGLHSWTWLKWLSSSFPIWNQSVVPFPVLTVASWPVNRFLRRQVGWSGIPISLRLFQFVVIHTVKGFGIVNKADVFLELCCFFDDPIDVGNLISSSSTFSKLY